jgi:hypothetical protein
MPIVRLVTDGEPDEEVISISLENKPKILSDIWRALPSLRKEMRKKWPTLTNVEIRHRVPPRLKNPVDVTQHNYYLVQAWVADARLVLAAIFTSQVAVEFAKEVIRPSAKEVGEYLRRWVRKFTASKSRKKVKAPTRKKRR